MTLLNLDPEQEWKKKFPLNIFMQTYTNEILIHYRATSKERDVTHVAELTQRNLQRGHRGGGQTHTRSAIRFEHLNGVISIFCPFVL